MTYARIFPAACLCIIACGSTKPATRDQADRGDDLLEEAPVAATAAPKTPAPTASAKPEPSADPGAVSSFAAAPMADFVGSTLRLTYEGATATLADSALVPSGKTFILRFQQPAANGAHVFKLMPKELAAGVPSKIEGKGSFFLQLSDGKNADGTFKRTDVTDSCEVNGTLTIAELPKAGGKAKGSVDLTITCKGVEDLREPFTLKGEFSGVPLMAK